MIERYMITDQDVIGLHAWSGVEDEDIKYLGNVHRHVFRIRCGWRVSHNDRDKEILQYQDKVLRALCANYEVGPQMQTLDFGGSSCEDIAEYLLTIFSLNGIAWCEVLEDDRGGARLVKSRKS